MISRVPFKATAFCVSVICGVTSSICIQQLLWLGVQLTQAYGHSGIKTQHLFLCSVPCRCGKNINLNHREQKWGIFIK